MINELEPTPEVNNNTPPPELDRNGAVGADASGLEPFTQDQEDTKPEEQENN